MAATARSKRTTTPKVVTQAEVPATPAPVSAPKTSIWTRVKSTATKVATTVAKPFKAIGRAAKAVVARVGSAKPVATAKLAVGKFWVLRVKPLARRVRAYMGPRLARTWTTFLRPMLSMVLLTVAVTAVAVAAVVSPIGTVVGLGVAALAAFGTAKGLEYLERHELTSRAARVTLRVLETIARAVVYFAYGVAGGLLLAMCVASPSFAFFVVGMALAAFFSSALLWWIVVIADCILTGNPLVLLAAVYFTKRWQTDAWRTDREVPEYSEIRRTPRVHGDTRRATRFEEELAKARTRAAAVDAEIVKDVTPADAPDAPATWTRGNHLVAKGTEELWGTEHDVPFVVHDDADEGRAATVAEPPWDEAMTNEKVCGACGTDKGAMRVRSIGVPFATSGAARGQAAAKAPAPEWLCSTCFQAECEDVAIALTDVSLDAKSVDVRLNAVGIAQSTACQVSRALFEGNLTDAQIAWLTERGWDGDAAYVWDTCAWYRDAHGTMHERVRHCMLNGKEVAHVVYDHKSDRNRKAAYRASVMGSTVGPAKRSWQDAMALACDLLDSEQHAVELAEKQSAQVVAGPVARKTKA